MNLLYASAFNAALTADADIGLPSSYFKGSAVTVNSTASIPGAIFLPDLSPIVLYLSIFGRNDFTRT